jgi:hypothetical protein
VTVSNERVSSVSTTYHVHHYGYRGLPAVRWDMTAVDAWRFFHDCTATGSHWQTPTVGYPVPDSWDCVVCAGLTVGS